ncbi:hypothetical protein [Sorangium sp. So ce1182]|uniref:hypothetical protein n=1 Tax=Sorangium sp. So ce1182 TaxID=3133334 RepID=UPI003F603945
MRATYRNDEDVARLHIESLLERHRAQVDALPEHLRRIYGRRVARSLAGTVALGGALTAAVLSAAGVIAREVQPSSDARGAGTVALLAAWAAVAIAYAVGRLLARAKLRDALAREVRRSGDVHSDRARLEAAAPDERARALVEEEERRSIALPLAGVAVLAPLSLHLAFHVLRFAASSDLGRLLVDFDGWIVLSLVLVGHVHAIVAYLSFSYARKLRESSMDELIATPPPGGPRALGIAILASLIPGAILVLLPPILVAVTGALVLLPAFHAAYQCVLCERRQLSAG